MSDQDLAARRNADLTNRPEPDEPEEKSGGFGLGLLIGVVTGIAASAIAGAYWRNQARQRAALRARQRGTVTGRRRGPPSTLPAFEPAPDGCAARPARIFGLSVQLPSIAAPAALDEPTMTPAGTAIQVRGVWLDRRDEHGRVRCDVIRQGDARLLGAYLGAEDFDGNCRDWFVTVTAPYNPDVAVA